MTKQTVLDRMPLGGVRRVESHPQTPPEPSAQRHQVFLEAQRTAYPGQQLEAPGILANPVPVEALYDPDAARDVALRNCDGLVALAEALLDFRAESDLTSLAGTPCSVLAKGRPATLD